MDDEAIELMLARGTFLAPTLLAPLAVLEQAEAGGSMPEWGIRKSREVIEIHSENIGKAFKAGVNIAMGTDAWGDEHGTNLRELGLMCNVGLFADGFDCGYDQNGRTMPGVAGTDRLGTLEAGKLADVIVCQTDPLADRSLENVDNIRLVVKDGRIMKNLM